MVLYLCDCTDGVDIGSTSRLHTNEREEETEDQSEDGFSDIHVEEFCENGDTENDTCEETGSPP